MTTPKPMFRVYLLVSVALIALIVFLAALVPAHKTGDQAKSSWSGVVAQAPAPYRR
jgi:hypothetical protein